ncbi:MAG TPA: alkyl sulfatase dimerization domain-containing protein [Solimonas sp.]|nr:alkyl sulfatase dimerization domain-containing protein [Solimonas sp.]
MNKLASLLLSVLLSVLLAACGQAGQSAPPPLKVNTQAELAKHSEEFRRELIKVADGVWCASGYGTANTIFLEGAEGVVVVDVQTTLESAREILADFRKVSEKPIRALIYTHSHPDHTYGAGAFAADAALPGLPVYSHKDVAATIDHLATEFQPILTQRALHMYGALLSDQEMVNIGIGPRMELNADSTLSIVRPNRVFDDRIEDTVAGVHFVLQHAPGETDDQIFVWLPERKILLPGDNFYRSFPNLYTIRGTTYRNLKGWAASLDKMRALRPEILVPSHSRPLAGADAIYAALTDYRDAIRYVYDQTVRMINQGRTPDEIAAKLRLPAHLAASPYLQEFYGTARWSARSVFAGNLGWFDGNPATLDPLPPDEEARRFVELAGGAEAFGKRIGEAVAKGEHQWVLQLTDRALRANPGDTAARDARIAALSALGAAASNPNARHWYLTSAHELKDGLKVPTRLAKPQPEMLQQMPTAVFFEGLAVNLHAEDALEVNRKVGFHFTDTGEVFTLWVRRGVCEVQPALLDNLDLEVEVTAQAFKELLGKLRNPALSIASDFKLLKGGKLEFAQFMKLFSSADADT